MSDEFKTMTYVQFLDNLESDLLDFENIIQDEQAKRKQRLHLTHDQWHRMLALYLQDRTLEVP